MPTVTDHATEVVGAVDTQGRALRGPVPWRGRSMYSRVCVRHTPIIPATLHWRLAS